MILCRVLTAAFVFTTFSVSALTLDVEDLPKEVRSESFGSDIGSSKKSLINNYGKNWAGNSKTLLFTFGLQTVRQLDILVSVQNGDRANMVSYTSSKKLGVKLSSEVVEYLVKKNFPDEKWEAVDKPEGVSDARKSADGNSSWFLSENRSQLVLISKTPIKLTKPDAGNLDIKSLEKMAMEGSVKAQSLLGEAYFHGKGVAIDYEKAVLWLKKAADKGEMTAQGVLGAAYVKGFGVEKDLVKARNLLKKSALQGNSKVQDVLAGMYALGLGGARDDVSAFAWFSIAATNGRKEGQNGIELMIKQGITETDVEKAKQLSIKLFKENPHIYI